MLTNKTAVSLVANAVYNTTRLFKITKYLTQSGRIEKLTIIGFWEKELKLTEERSESVKIRRIMTLKQKWQKAPKFLTKPITLVSLIIHYFAISRACVKEKPEIVYCHDVLLLPIALWAKFVISSTIIYMPHELETLETGNSKFVNICLRQLEWFAIKFIKHTTVVSPKIKDWYCDAYGISKVSLIRNIPELFDEEICKEKKLRNLLNLTEKDIVFIYQGLIVSSRGVIDVATSFTNLVDTNKHVVFMGYGPDVYLIESLALRYKNIHYIPAVDPSEICSYTSDADVGALLIFEKVSKSYEYSLPNKYFEYVNSGIPILVTDNLLCVNTEVLEHSTGWIIKSSESQFLDFLIKITKDEIIRMKQSVINTQAKYNWEDEVKILLEF